MLAYRLRHRVTFEEFNEGQVDENGFPTSGGWQTVTLPGGLKLEDVPAEVLTGPGREWVGSAAPQSDTSARINVRWFPADEREMAAWRVLWDGRVYGIQSVETDATARREWRLRCIYGPSQS